MEIKEIKGNTFCIDTGITYIPFYKINSEEIIMLDSGWSQGKRKGIDEFLEKNNYKVVGIICTHAHIDHVGNNAYFKEKYNSIIAMPAYEALICSSVVNLKVCYSNQTLSDVTKHFGSMVFNTDIMISNNQNSISMLGINFKILHTPGHSPAHICIITPDDVAYLGDTLISDEIMNMSKMPYAYILREDMLSKLKLYDLKSSKYIVAHKGVYNDITKLITDNIAFYENRASKIYDLIKDVMTMQDILRAVTKEFNIHINTRNRYTLIERLLWPYIEYLIEKEMLEIKMDDGFLIYSKCPTTIA